MIHHLIFFIADPITLVEISKENDTNYALFRINESKQMKSCEMVRKTVKNSDNWKTHVDCTADFLKKSKKNNGQVKIKVPPHSNSNYFYAFKFQDVDGETFVTDSKYLNSKNEFIDEREIDVKRSSAKDNLENNCSSPRLLTFFISFLIIVGLVLIVLGARWIGHREYSR